MGALYGVLGSKGVVDRDGQKNVRNVIAVWIVFMFARNRMCYVRRCWMSKARRRSLTATA
ncbi:Uncharacterised protein [Salmonella enterica subsp. enterica]|uniref:Uncharacterized protein n=1 Tax=Salmonella enterica I TaxID=59201 RepID=A0A447TZM0_SALET|nr:Uncharacterised protein [Salmonella enterica subsp. enterica]